MKKNYDKVVEEHYRKVADEHGLSATSTMADEITRKLETDMIIRFVEVSLSRRADAGISEPPTIMDVGCGNGFTLEVLSKHFPQCKLIGIEKSFALRSLAQSRFADQSNIKIIEGDVREKSFSGLISADILLCQRVIINLLDSDDQNTALENMIDAVASPANGRLGGTLLFIESFTSSLEKLNEARSEFDLPSIPAADHNLYLPDNFFERSNLKPLPDSEHLLPPNFLSSHYFVARVLHPVFTQDKPLKRNSEFVRFFSQAFKEPIGDYSPLRLSVFEKI